MEKITPLHKGEHHPRHREGGHDQQGGAEPLQGQDHGGAEGERRLHLPVSHRGRDGRRDQ